MGTLALLQLSLRYLCWPICKLNVRGRRDFKIIPLEILQHEREVVVCFLPAVLCYCKEDSRRMQN